MNRILMTVTLLLTLISQGALGALYKLTETVDVKPQPNSKLVEIWIPIPYESRWQKIRKIEVSSPYPYLLTKEDEYGNRFIYVRKENGIKEPFRIRIETLIDRKEVSPTKRNCPVPARYYLSDRLVPVEKFKKLAEAITKGKKTDLEKMKAIYNYVVSHMRYSKTGKGWGRGDAIWACSAKHGNCTDFHSLFIALCRAAGIPAVFEIGLPINGNGEVKGYHCWVMAFPKGYTYGIDASEASKHPEKRRYYFGHLCDHRIGITRGRDILLNPPQHGERLNYLYKAYEEVDLKPNQDVQTKFKVVKVK
ncbi:Transglutaminase-like enzyme, putative cysteine protease [Balnearium lithotrophicum]|uniref:Transglutaminase-like enzyme, putative cysteine protease n=1 Tax=Balnearium lithotrophicum TaxID=223788 RepID=A0A521D863_9BACT|nr:transglutaminase domain-containing protein [Balnearium lithotrophicum]SMO67802.1 Transglutaminase-like enzyme, putative cysteine protease [Balnearium lithotrophicum]